MNIADLAALVCETVRKPDSDSLSACKNYLKQRDQMLWDGNLWRDSLVMLSTSLDPDATFDVANNPLVATNGVVLLPRLIQKVLAIRKTSGPVPVQVLERFFMDSLDAFNQTGEPVEFSLLSPVVLQLAEETFFWAWTGGASVAVQSKCYDSSTQMYGRVNATVTTPTNIGYTAELVDVTKAPQGDNYVLSLGYGPNSNSITTFDSVPPLATRATPRQRIRLLPAPTKSLSLRVLGKQRYDPIVSDYEEPRLALAENVLIAYATGDMMRRSNKFGMANEAYAEGAALLGKLENIEFFQQAQRMQLVPEIEGMGFGQDVGSNGSTKGFW